MIARIVSVLALGTLIVGCADAPTAAVTGTASADRGGPSAPPTQCAGVVTGFVPGNLVVPAGSHCTIVGATIGGNVQVEPGAAAFQAFTSTVQGSVHAPGPILHGVWIVESNVGKGVDIRGVSPSSASVVCGSQVGGNVKMIENPGVSFVGAGYL